MTAKKILFATILAAWACLLLPASQRQPRDIVGFCWNAETMNQLVHLLESVAIAPPAPSGWVAGICPHDDYLYAGRIYLPLFRNLQAKEAVIFGVTHGSVRRAVGDPRGKIILDTHEQWTGINGPVQISPLRDWLRAHLPTKYLLVSDKAHDLEHSIEALVPFLQHFRPGIRITPIMVTAMTAQELPLITRELSRHLASWLHREGLRPGEDVVFIISADANHYGEDFDNAPYGDTLAAHTRAKNLEQKLIREWLEGPLRQDHIERLQSRLDPAKNQNAPLWCGRFSIPFGLMTVLNLLGELEPDKTLSGRLLAYSDTWSEGVLPLHRTSLGITAPFSLKHWVSFFSMAFAPVSDK